MAFKEIYSYVGEGVTTQQYNILHLPEVEEKWESSRESGEEVEEFLDWMEDEYNYDLWEDFDWKEWRADNDS